MDGGFLRRRAIFGPAAGNDCDARSGSAAAFDGPPAHIAILDESGIIVAVNQPYSDGATAGEQFCVGANYLLVWDAAQGHGAETMRAVPQGIRDVLTNCRDEFRLEYPASTAGGLRWLLCRVTRLASNGPECVVVAHVDITEWKRAEEALRTTGEELSAANAELVRTAQDKDELLASMSHELRTPLNGLLFLSQNLQEGVYGALNREQIDALNDVEECCRDLLALVNDILDLAKMEAGKVELELASLDVGPLCQTALRLVKGTAQRKHINQVFWCDPSVINLVADQRRLTQALVNLLSNAVKFTPDGGTVGLEVAGDRDQQQVRFSVLDTGIGIRSEDLPRLCQPFVQLDTRLSQKDEGCGLGLALVMRLAELHHGHLLIESNPGRGSRFTIVLPWIKQESPEDKNPTEASCRETDSQ